MRPFDGFKIIIPTRGRAGDVKALRVFPTATLCVGDSEHDAYAAAYPGVDILTHPDDVVGLGKVRQWVNDHCTEEVVCQVDDDVVRMVGLSDGYRVHYSVEDVFSVVQSAAYCARGAGTTVFGFNPMPDVRKYTPLSPIAFNKKVDGLLGLIGRDHHWMPELKMRDDVDVDFCLTTLLRQRIIWCDQRYSFEHKRFSGPGGNAVSRSREQDQYEIDLLHRKWGKWLSIRKVKTTTAPCYHVER